MLRADDVIAGTSTTGTGTLTLAVCPAPPGGMDFYHWLTATGIGFATGKVVLVSYTIIEYTDNTFATSKQIEKGVGTLTLGASLTASTLARTTVQSTGASLNTSTPALTISAPTAITIGTAANVLVFVGTSVQETISFPPGIYQQTTGGAGLSTGLPPLIVGQAGSSTFSTAVSGTDYYFPIIWLHTMLVKRLTLVCGNSTLSGSTANWQGRLYQCGTDGKPGRLLYDFGQLGTSAAGTSAFSGVASGASGNGFLMTPGMYWLNWFPTWTGGSGTLVMQTCTSLITGLSGHSNGQGYGCLSATGGSTTAADPANVTGFTNESGFQNQQVINCSFGSQ